MTKEDYMHLPKERLAELLVEKDRLLSMPPIIHPEIFPQCWEPGGKCMNPFRDCINCPRTGSDYGSFTTTITTSLDDTTYTGLDGSKVISSSSISALCDETRGTQENNSQMEEGRSSEKRTD